MSFNIDDFVILNEKVRNGLPSHIGEVVTIYAHANHSPNYDFTIMFDNGDLNPVKESEINKLTEEQIHQVSYIKNGNEVIYTPTNETVKILKCDFLHGQVEVEFEDAGIMVVRIEMLKKSDNENIHIRKSWDQYFMDIATTVSTRATCDRLHVGCVIVKDKKIVSTGYNGSPSGKPHCDDIGHLHNEQGRCVRTIHAEQNAILYANREDLQDATAYVTHQPCENCAKLLVQSGVSRIVYKEKYDNKFSYFFMNMVENICLKEE